MKKIISIIFIYSALVFGQKVNYDISLVYVQGTGDTKTKIDDFTKKLKDALNNYDWEFPLTDFETIENSVYINLEKEETLYKFKGLITISSGLKQNGHTVMLQKRDVLFSENNAVMQIAYNDEPDLQGSVSNSLENVLKFYTYCALLENFDRLSYTDNANFYLYGDKYINKLTTLIGQASGSEASSDWDVRKRLADNYLNGSKNEERRLSALIYNARYFINAYQQERAVYFLPHILNRLEKIPKEAQTAFYNNYYAELAELVKIEPDKSYLEKLKKMDPVHAKIYGK